MLLYHGLKYAIVLFSPRCIICRAVFPIAKVTVGPSVRASVTRVNCDKMNKSSAEILMSCERKIHVLFRTQRMVGGGRPLLPEILG